MSGNLTVPNAFAALTSSPVSALDQNFNAIALYINGQELTIGTIAARPLVSVGHQWYLATDQNGGTLYAGDGVGGWVQVAAPVNVPAPSPSGLIQAASLLLGDRSGTDYSTTSATYVDVDSTNLKASIVVPVGSKFALAMASYTVSPLTTSIADGLDHVRIFGASQPMILASFTNAFVINPVGARSIYGLLANPASGPQDFALQFRGDGANTFGISNPAADGTTGSPFPVFQPMMLVIVTT